MILAGGRSRRLGVDKTTMSWPPASSELPELLRYQPGLSGHAGPAGPDATDVSRAVSRLGASGYSSSESPAPAPRTLLGATAAKLSQVCAEVLVVGYGGDVPVPYRVVSDLYQDGGSLGGIYSGLAAAAHGYALAVATDMPFLSLPLLRWLLDQPRDYDALVPVRRGPEPLHAIYAKRCLEPMRRRLDAGRLRITELFDDVRVRYVDAAELAALDPEELSFFNINTPEDLARAAQLLAR